MTPDDILDFLTANDRDYTAESVAKRFKRPVPATRLILDQLAGMGLIRRATAERLPRYYVATMARVAAESRAACVQPFRPLRIDRARAELYARLAAERG